METETVMVVMSIGNMTPKSLFSGQVWHSPVRHPLDQLNQYGVGMRLYFDFLQVAGFMLAFLGLAGLPMSLLCFWGRNPRIESLIARFSAASALYWLSTMRAESVSGSHRPNTSQPSTSSAACWEQVTSAYLRHLTGC